MAWPLRSVLDEGLYDLEANPWGREGLSQDPSKVGEMKTLHRGLSE